MFKYIAIVLMLSTTCASAAHIDISNTKHILTYVDDDGNVFTYPVAVGTKDEQVNRDFVVLRKQQNPSWTPTPDMIRKEHMSPKTVPPGPRNPLGVRILYLSDPDGRPTYYGIHGTNHESSVGKSASHGCFRMHKADILELYDMVFKGTTVSVHD